MKQITLSAPYDFTLQQSETPQIATKEILVKVAYCAICGTDIRVLEGKKRQDISYPCVIGHEISGLIYKVGSDVTGFDKGERVNVAPIIPCGHCRSCLSGQENLCQNRLAIGYQFGGGFAEYVRIPAIAVESGNIIKVSNHVSLEEASLLEPLACCINGIKKARIDINDNVLIVGAGAIGQLHLLLCKLYGVNFVAVSDPLPHRREKAIEFGANAVIDPSKEDISEIAAKYGISDFNKIIIACAANSVVNSVLDYCSLGGIIVLFSGFSGTGLSELTLNSIHYKEIELVGSRGYVRQNYLAAVSLLENRNLKMQSLISDIYPLERFRDAYELQKGGRGFKVLVRP
jgi:L-iditol 2-dehydrogenase